MGCLANEIWRPNSQFCVRKTRFTFTSGNLVPKTPFTSLTGDIIVRDDSRSLWRSFRKNTAHYDERRRFLPLEDAVAEEPRPGGGLLSSQEAPSFAPGRFNLASRQRIERMESPGGGPSA